MSKFYATIKGNRNAKTCGGSDNSGIKAAAQSYDGSVIVSLSYRNDNKDLFVNVGINENSSSVSGWNTPEFFGSFQEFKDLLQLSQDIKSGKVSITKHTIN